MASNSIPIDILVIGLGAVGTIYSYILSEVPNVRVTAVARSSYDSFKDGITIESEKFGQIHNWKPYRIVADPSDANDRVYDFIVATFKCVPDLLPSASVVAPFLEGPYGRHEGQDGPTVVLIQNGIGIEHPIQTAYPLTPVISVVAWIGANRKDSVVTHGMLEKLVMGLYLGEGINSPANPLAPEEVISDLFSDPAGYKSAGGEARLVKGWSQVRLFESLLKAGGGEVEVVADIQPKRYEKNVWNAAWSSLCSISRCPVSALVAPDVLPFTLPVVRRIGLEVIYIAREWGYSEQVLPLKAVDEAIRITIANFQIRSGTQTPATPAPKGDAFGGLGYNFPPNGESEGSATATFKPSMLLDIEAGRPSELEPILGSLLDRARAKGVETPRLDLAYAALKVSQQEAVRKYAESASYQKHIADWFLRKPSVAGAGLDGRKQWEKAMRQRRAEDVERDEDVEVRMTQGKKVTGKPVRAGTDD